MEFIKGKKEYKVKKSYLTYFLKKYWFIPSDVLQRGMEANIWDLCTFRAPVLDIGVGNGEISEFIFKKQPQMDTGIDIDNSQLDKARATGRYKKVLQVDAENMPFKDESFRTVVSNSTFEHMQNDKKAVAEVARVLKKDGLFFLTVPSEFLSKWILLYETERNKTTAQEKLEKFNKRTHHLHYNSLSTWKNIFKKNKLEVVFYRYYFPKSTALFWYKLFNLATYSIRGRELWSLIGHSRITSVFPQSLITKVLKEKILKNAYQNGFLTTEEGGQLFIIAKKV